MGKNDQKELLTEMLSTLRLMRDLMAESDGVAGYHANGEVMAWDEWQDLSPTALDDLIDKAEFTTEV